MKTTTRTNTNKSRTNTNQVASKAQVRSAPAAPRVKIKGGIAGSVEKLRADAKAGGASGNESYIKYIPADGSIIGRFVTEPDQFFSFYQHYDEVFGSYPCVSDDCPGCTEGDKPRQVWLANFVITGEDRVVPLQLPKTLLNKLLSRYERRQTIMDRDYELIRSGKGLDTEYDIEADAPTKFNINKFEALDLGEVLSNQYDRAFASQTDDDEDLEEEKVEKPKQQRRAQVTDRTAGGKVARAVQANRKSSVVEDEDDDEDEDDEENETLSRGQLEAMKLRELRTYAREETSLSADDIKSLDKPELVDAILGESSTDEEVDDDEEDDDSEEVRPGDESDDDADDEDDTEADDDEEDEETTELSEDEVRAMKLPQLRALCKELGIKAERTDSRNKLIEKVLDYASIPF